MRPYVKPGVPRFWRDDVTLQFGLDPDRAVVLTDVEPAVARFIDMLTGATDLATSMQRAAADGVDADLAAAVLRVLADAGVLDDADTDASPLRSLSAAEREQLAPDLVARSLASRTPGSGVRALRVRRAASVAITGGARVGSSIAALLASSGIGHLVVTDRQEVSGADVSPAGFGPVDVGRSRVDSLRRIIAAKAPSTRVTQRAGGRPDVVVIAADDEPERALPIQLVRDGIPHLVVGVREAVGVVGPFVLPGSSACLHCLDLHRADIDPLWPSLLAQRQSAPTASATDVTMATLVASMATLHVLDYLDGREPVSVDGTLSVGFPDGVVRRRTWSPHSRCGCTWASLATPVSPPADQSSTTGAPADEGPDAR